MPLKRDPQPTLDGVQYSAVDCLRIIRSIDQCAARTVLCSNLPKAVAQPFVEVLVEELKSVVDTPSRPSPREAQFGGQIKDHSQVGGEISKSKAM